MPFRLFVAVLVMAVMILPAAFAGHAAATESEDLSAPMRLSKKTDDIWRAIEGASWISLRDPDVKPNGRILYAVTFRSCPSCAAFKASEYDELIKAGVEVRWVLYARRDHEGKARSLPGERAMIAELWLNRRADLLTSWWAADDLGAFYAQAGLPKLADGDPKREAAIAQGRALVDRLSGLFKDNGLDLAIPTLIWRQEGDLMAYVGYSRGGFAPARAFLTGN